MKKTMMFYVVILCLGVVSLFSSGTKAFAATQVDRDQFNSSQFKDILSPTGGTNISFVKGDGTSVSAANPLVKTEGDAVSLNLGFSLKNMTDIIDQVANGSINGMSSESMLFFVKMLQKQAVITGSFRLEVDLSAGMGKYFTINQAVLNSYISNPNGLFDSNPAFANTFDVYGISVTDNKLDVDVKIKDNVFGEQILELADSYTDVNFVLKDIIQLNTDFWDNPTELTDTKLANLAQLYTPEDEAIFNANIPQSLVGQASIVGATNPFVGIKLESIEPSNAGLAVAVDVFYDGNGNTSGTVPVDILNPYKISDTITIKDKGTLSRYGYQFLGWSTTKNYNAETDVLYQPLDNYSIMKDTTFYAQWLSLSKDVTVKYEDTKGNAIAEEVVLSGDVGETYTSEQKNITGYTFTKMKEGSASSVGTFTEEEQVVTYVYDKEKTSVVVDPTSENADPNDSLPKTGEKSTLLFSLLGASLIIFSFNRFIEKIKHN